MTFVTKLKISPPSSFHHQMFDIKSELYIKYKTAGHFCLTVFVNSFSLLIQLLLDCFKEL